MKNIIFLFLGLFFLQSCKKESFEYTAFAPVPSDVDSIYFSTGSPSLIADGKASLQFVLEAYRKVRVTTKEGAQKDSMMLLDYTALPSTDVKIFADDKSVNGMEYSTKEIEKSSITFYAQIGDIKSKVKTVQLRKPQALPTKRYVDVIFHVFELESTDKNYNPLTYQVIEQKHIQEAIEYANVVFSNAIGRDPNGGNAQIEFRLATKNVNGASLPMPGYNKIMYNSTWQTYTFFSLDDFTKKVNANSAYQWDSNKFLNIYILPITASTSLGNNRANYQIVPSGEEPIPGILNVVNSSAEVPTDDFYTTYGLGIHRNIFIPGADRKVEIAGYLGVYYGLLRTTSAEDYVSDTRNYSTTTNKNLNSLLKIGVDGEKFLANNALDDIRYASLRNSFTLGQVDRMRLVMDRSPVRKAWKLQ